MTEKSDLDITNEEKIVVPMIGMKFNGLEEVCEFYKTYAKEIGFPVRKRSSCKNVLGETRSYTFCCARAGTNRSTSSKPQVTIRCGCLAKLVIRLDQLVGWVISKIVLEHNHELSPDKARYYRCNRNINPRNGNQIGLLDGSGLRLNKSYNSLVNEDAGHVNMTCTGKDKCTEKDMRGSHTRMEVDISWQNNVEHERLKDLNALFSEVAIRAVKSEDEFNGIMQWLVMKLEMLKKHEESSGSEPENPATKECQEVEKGNEGDDKGVTVPFPTTMRRGQPPGSKKQKTTNPNGDGNVQNTPYTTRKDLTGIMTEKSDLDITNEQKIVVPIIGMKFDGLEEVWEFYRTYAKEIGFPIRKRSSCKNVLGEIRSYTFCCARAGANTSTSSKPQMTIRCGCLAKLVIRLDQLVGWVISKIVLEHNHDLSPDKARYYRCNRNINPRDGNQIGLLDSSGVRLNKSYNSLVNEDEGYVNTTCTGKDKCTVKDMRGSHTRMEVDTSWQNSVEHERLKDLNALFSDVANRTVKSEDEFNGIMQWLVMKLEMLKKREESSGSEPKSPATKECQEGEKGNEGDDKGVTIPSPTTTRHGQPPDSKKQKTTNLSGGGNVQSPATSSTQESY